MNEAYAIVIAGICIAIVLAVFAHLVDQARRTRLVRYNESLLNRRDRVKLGDGDLDYYQVPTRKHWFQRKTR